MVIYAFVLGAMALDVFTGLVLAIKEHEVDSSKMRDGLYKKFANSIFCVVGYFAELAQAYAGINLIIPTGTGVAAIVVTMETISILENLCKINPDLFKFIRPYLKKLQEVNGIDTSN